uniref:Uncharacterized protein n=1 Tax=Yersinia ruckeri TaxID=29486 RepID=A0A0A8VKQ8_YERRU|nr:hypothetical protein CSF007_16230 [Yersinia ruckeri]
MSHQWTSTTTFRSDPHHLTIEINQTQCNSWVFYIQHLS